MKRKLRSTQKKWRVWQGFAKSRPLPRAFVARGATHVAINPSSVIAPAVEGQRAFPYSEDRMPTDILSLSWQVQVALGSGYAAYLTAYRGNRAHHTPVDAAF